MAISPPSDLVLDVVRAADPSEVQAAQAKLKASKAAFAASSLADAGQGFGAAMHIISQPSTAAHVDNPKVSSVGVKMPEQYRKFESSVLQTFVNSMLPSDSEQVYGKGSAGEFWKSMMAEQVSDQMSKNGGIGIAEQLFKQQAERAKAHGVVNATTDENDRSRAVSMIDDYQRQILGVSETEKSEV